MFHFFKYLNKELEGWPDTSLTLLLLFIGAFLILTALVAPRWAKVPVAIWAVF